jgi:hypothetical protein
MKRTLFATALALILLPTVALADGRYRGGDHHDSYRGGYSHYDRGYSHYGRGYGRSSFGLSFGYSGGYYDRGYYAPRYVGYRPYYAPVYYRPAYIERSYAPVRYYDDCDYGYYRPSYYRPYSGFSFSFGYRGRW